MMNNRLSTELYESEVIPATREQDFSERIIEADPQKVTIYLDPLTLIEHKTEEESDTSPIDNEICEYIKSYNATLVNGERAEFKTLSLDDKINKICWMWSLDESNTEKRQAAARLRGLTIVRSLEQAVTYKDDGKYPDNHSKPYSMPVGVDPFWRDVEKEIDSILEDYKGAHYSFDRDDDTQGHTTSDSISIRVLACESASVWKTYSMNEDRVSSVAYTAAW